MWRSVQAHPHRASGGGVKAAAAALSRGGLAVRWVRLWHSPPTARAGAAHVDGALRRAQQLAARSSPLAAGRLAARRPLSACCFPPSSHSGSARILSAASARTSLRAPFRLAAGTRCLLCDPASQQQLARRGSEKSPPLPLQPCAPPRSLDPSSRHVLRIAPSSRSSTCAHIALACAARVALLLLRLPITPPLPLDRAAASTD
jgi:hypothetical protein